LRGREDCLFLLGVSCLVPIRGGGAVSYVFLSEITHLAQAKLGTLEKLLDPFLGSGTTAVVAEQLKRRWKGCDISPEYCSWAGSED
jgi:hypothetical protein